MEETCGVDELAAMHAEMAEGIAWVELAETAADHLAFLCDAELEIAVDRLRAADAAAAAAAAARLRAIDLVRAASLAADAARARLLDERQAARGEQDGPGRPSGIGEHPRTASPRATRSRDISERSARAEIALALAVSEGSAGALVETAELVRRRHPAVLAAMTGGRIRERHATRLVRSVGHLPPEAGDRVVADALPQADRAFSRFAAIVDRLVRREQPDPPDELHRRAMDDRAVWITGDRDGTAVLSQVMSAVDARAVFDRITAMAVALGRDPDETRTRDQLRADVLRDLQLDGETDSLPRALRGIRPTVFVTVPALALATDDGAYGEAVVEGVGPIDRQTAASLVGAASEWTRVLTHPVSGMVLSIDRERYRPPSALARVVRWAHGTCTFPGCRTPAHRCELDHIRDWRAGGSTGVDNLQPLCTGHHTVKHATRWRVAPDPGGGVSWTSPAGQRSASPPANPWRTPVSVAAEDPPPF